MSSIRLLRRAGNQLVTAQILPIVSAPELIAVEAEWGKYRAGDKQSGNPAGKGIPEHNHWNWAEKSSDLRFTAYRCLGIECEGDVQGLILVSTLAASGRHKKHLGKPVLYVKYLESAPWNLSDYVGDERRFAGVGTQLIRIAISVSFEEEFRGRIALHSLPQSEGFYGRFMTDLGVDPAVEGLRYFEMTEEQVQNFLKGGEV